MVFLISMRKWEQKYEIYEYFYVFFFSINGLSYSIDVNAIAFA